MCEVEHSCFLATPRHEGASLAKKQTGQGGNVQPLLSGETFVKMGVWRVTATTCPGYEWGFVDFKLLPMTLSQPYVFASFFIRCEKHCNSSSSLQAFEHSFQFFSFTQHPPMLMCFMNELIGIQEAGTASTERYRLVLG